jgi:tripartite-type tricarboxylate transporter receptor subunit TctC
MSEKMKNTLYKEELKMKKRRSILFFGILISLVFILFIPAWAKYPEKMITIIVPWPPGGRSDLIGRILAPAVEKHAGTQVTVINKPGAGGVVGAKEVANSKPDGYTTLIISNTLIWFKYSIDVPMDIKDYVPVCQIINQPQLLVVSAKAPWKDLKDFVVYAKANPGKAKIAMTTTKGLDLLFVHEFQEKAGFKGIKVPYNGDAPAVAAVAGQHVDILLAPFVSVMSMLEAGELKALGVASEKRNPLRPQIPTFKEQGVDVVLVSNQALYAPKGTPPEATNTLAKTVEKALKEPELVNNLEKLGLGGEIEFMGPQEYLKEVMRLDEIYKKFKAEVGI